MGTVGRLEWPEVLTWAWEKWVLQHAWALPMPSSFSLTPNTGLSEGRKSQLSPSVGGSVTGAEMALKLFVAGSM